MKILLILLLISCGKGASNDSSTKKNLEPKYRNLDGDFQARKEEEDAAPNEKEKNLDDTEEINKVDYYSLLIDNEINIEELIQEIQNDKRFSIFEKENLLKKLIEDNHVNSEKTIFLIKKLYVEEMNSFSLINHTINLIVGENDNKYIKVMELLLEKKLESIQIEELFQNFINRINSLEIAKYSKQLTNIGKLLVDKYFDLNLYNISTLKIAKNILNLHLSKKLLSQEFNKEIILYVINKLEDDPLSSYRKNLIEELKQKYKQNSFILELVAEEIK